MNTSLNHLPDYKRLTRTTDPTGMDVTLDGTAAQSAFADIQKQVATDGSISADQLEYITDKANQQDENSDFDGGKEKKHQQNKSQPQPQPKPQQKRRSQQDYYPPPSTIPGFPGSGKGTYNNESDRKRWKLPDGIILEWDYKKGRVEKFDKTGKNHLGEYDSQTGLEFPGKRHPSRTTPKTVGTPQPNIFATTALKIMIPLISIMAHNLYSSTANQAVGASLGSEIMTYIGTYGVFVL